jgi:hypothetical protein
MIVLPYRSLFKACYGQTGEEDEIQEQDFYCRSI